MRTIKKQSLKIAAICLAAVLSLPFLAGCGGTNGGPSASDPVTELPAQDAAETGTPALTSAPTKAPAPEPTEAPKPTEAPEPTEAPDYSGGIEEGVRKTYNMFGTSGATTGAYCGTGHVIAMQFYATTDFLTVGFHSPTWTAKSGYSLEYELYRWNTGYEETLEQEPLVTGSFENWEDGVCVPLKADQGAGEYLLVAYYYSAEEAHNSGVWYEDVEREDQRAYLDGSIWYDCAIRATIVYANKPNVAYGPLSDSGLE